MENVFRHAAMTKVVGTLNRVVCYTAVFSVVTQRSSLLSGEERCVTTLKTAV